MEEGKRQKQIAGLLHEDLTAIFQRLSLNMMDGGMVSISNVKITPDLLEARIYLSFFKVNDATATLKKIEDRGWEIKKEITGTANVRNDDKCFLEQPVLSLLKGYFILPELFPCSRRTIHT